MAQHVTATVQHVPRAWKRGKHNRHSPIKSTVCPVLLSTDTKLLPPEVPDFAGLPPEASKVMV